MLHAFSALLWQCCQRHDLHHQWDFCNLHGRSAHSEITNHAISSHALKLEGGKGWERGEYAAVAVVGPYVQVTSSQPSPRAAASLQTVAA